MENQIIEPKPKKSAWRWIKWILLIAIILVALPLLYLFQPWVFLPHKPIQIGLPFAPEDDQYTSLIPMGEKIEHNASNGTPDGHPGIDFSWGKPTNILAVADGRITRIYKDKFGKYNIDEQMGYYKTMYKELNTIDPKLHFFSKVKKGQILGQTGYARDVKKEKIKKETDPSGQIHWDFGSASMNIDRLCPLTYFDDRSRERIEKIWLSIPETDQFRINYPEICNGIFKGKVE